MNQRANSPESRQVQPKKPERFQSHEELANLENQIIALDVQETKWRDQGEEFRGLAQQELDRIGDQIGRLQEEFADNSDFQILVQMYFDLAKDWNEGRKLDIDYPSVKQYLDLAQDRIQKAGIQRENVAEVSEEKAKAVLASLMELGIEVEYVTTYPEATGMPIILILHRHRMPAKNPKPYYGAALESQIRVKKIILDLYHQGLSNTIFVEGLKQTKSLSLKGAYYEQQERKNGGLAFVAAKLQLGDALTIKGVEKAPYHEKALLEKDSFASTLRSEKYGNVEIQQVIMGVAHETYGQNEKKHPLPFSEAIALQNQANVIVIDTTK